MTTLARSQVAIESILFATDLTRCSDAALPYVESIAEHFGAKIYLAHVVSPSTVINVSPSAPFMWPEARKALAGAMSDAARWQLAKLESSPEMRELRHESLLVQGDVVEVLQDMMVRYGVDLVVLGAHGRHGLGKFIMGSVSESVARGVLCPVLIVGPKAPHDHAPNAGTFQRILAAVDLDRASQDALIYAEALAQKHQASLLRFSGPFMLSAVLKDAEDRNADLIVVGGSALLACRLAAEAPCPVLSVPADFLAKE